MEAMSLIKFFSEKNHFQWFKDGISMFRTPHYYRKCEDDGRGDRSDSCILYRDRTLGDEIPQLVHNGLSLDLTSVQSLMIHPIYEQKDSWMQSWCVVGKFNEFELSLSRMLDEFGCYFAVLPANNIQKYAAALQQASGLNVRYGFVRYTHNPLQQSLSVKNRLFEYQKEFRFFVGECGKHEVSDKEIKVADMQTLLSEAGSLKLTSENGEVRYCSLGSKEVVLTE
jgi:hypothetical protein